MAWRISAVWAVDMAACDLVVGGVAGVVAAWQHQ